MKKGVIVLLVLLLLGGSSYWIFSGYQKQKAYEYYLSKQYVGDYSQMAGYVNMGEGYLSVILSNRQLEPEEQDALVHGLYEIAYVMQDYDDLSNQLALDDNDSSPHSIRTVMAMASYTANIEAGKLLSSDEMEKLTLMHELLERWNKTIVQTIPELNANEETFDVFMKKYQNEGITGTEWKEVLDLMEEHTKYVSEEEGIEQFSEFFYQD